METYIIGDTHFYHSNIAVYCNRPPNWSKLIFNGWNSTVQKEDLIIHLGDVALGGWDCLKELLSFLNGRKILVMGNHDHKSCHWYMQNGFEFACKSVVYHNILFTHQPTAIPSTVNYNVYAHFHNSPIEKHEYDLQNILTRKHYLYVLEEQNYRPVKLTNIKKLKKI